MPCREPGCGPLLGSDSGRPPTVPRAQTTRSMLGATRAGIASGRGAVDRVGTTALLHSTIERPPGHLPARSGCRPRPRPHHLPETLGWTWLDISGGERGRLLTP